MQNYNRCISVFPSLFRSQKSDLHNEGYVLELDCCSSLIHLTDQKIIPEFFKKVSPALRMPLNRFSPEGTGRGWLGAGQPYSAGWAFEQPHRGAAPSPQGSG